MTTVKFRTLCWTGRSTNVHNGFAAVREAFQTCVLVQSRRGAAGHPALPLKKMILIEKTSTGDFHNRAAPMQSMQYYMKGGVVCHKPSTVFLERGGGPGARVKIMWLLYMHNRPMKKRKENEPNHETMRKM